MKTSTIIAIALGILIVGGMLTYYIDLKINYNNNYKVKILLKEIELPPFTVIVADKDAEIYVEQSDSNKLSIRNFKDSIIPENLYAIKGDTLYIYSGLRLYLKCKNVNTIIGRRHYFVCINKVAPKDLKIDMMDGEFEYHNDEYKIDSMANWVTNLNISARDSAIVGIYTGLIDNIKINSDSAYIQLSTKAKNVTANLKNKASLCFNCRFQNLKVEMDKTSYYGRDEHYFDEDPNN